MKIKAALFGLATAKTLTNDVNLTGEADREYLKSNKNFQMIRQYVLIIQIEMIFPAVISLKTSDGH